MVLHNVSGKHRVLICNADLPLGSLVAEYLLREHGHKIEDVICQVQRFERSGDLIIWGGIVIKEDHLEHWMDHIDTLVLVPNCVDRNFEEQGRRVIEMAKQKNVEHVIMFSLLGVDEGSSDYLKTWKRLEDLLKNSGLSCSVVRHGLSQQSLYFFMKEIKYENKLKLPWKEDQKCAPVNTFDVAHFAAHLVTEHQQGRAHKQLFRLTGPELVTPRILVEKLNKCGANVKFEETDMKRMENYLRDIGFNEMMLAEGRAMFELINAGKLNFISDDEKKTIGKEPQSLENFFKENKRRFIASSR